MKNTTLNKYLALIVTFFCALAFGYGQSIFDNNIDGPDPSDDNPFINGQNVNGNITVSGIGLGNQATPRNGDNRYNASSWNTATLDPDAYFEFTITPNANIEIDFASFVYTAQRSNASIDNFALRSNIDGYTANIGTPDKSIVSPSSSGVPIFAV